MDGNQVLQQFRVIRDFFLAGLQHVPEKELVSLFAHISLRAGG